MATVRVLVVDDQAAFLRAMTCVVQETPGFEIAGEHFVAESGAAAYVAKSDLGPDLLEAAWSTAVR